MNELHTWGTYGCSNDKIVNQTTIHLNVFGSLMEDLILDDPPQYVCIATINVGQSNKSVNISYPTKWLDPYFIFLKRGLNLVLLFYLREQENSKIVVLMPNNEGFKLQEKKIPGNR